MITKEDIRPISYIKTNAANILAQVNETHRPVIITQNGEAKAILLDTESYESMQNALNILKLISISEKDIMEGRVAEQSEVFSAIEKKFLKMKK